MKKDLIIRAWKDPEFRAGLSSEDRAALPESPAGASMAELDEGSLMGVVGGNLADFQNIHDFPSWATPRIRVSDFARINVDVLAQAYRQ